MKILLIDDDPVICQALLSILERNPGLETAVAATGPHALEVAKELKQVDLLIADVVMDPMDGFTLRQKLLELYPAMKTIFVSGYDLSDYVLYTAGCDVLTKPFGADALLESVAKVEALLPKPVALKPRPVAAVAKPVMGGTPEAMARKATTIRIQMPPASPMRKETAVPAATAKPVATPVARPSATPVARPTATPVASPAATPVVAPVATPVASPAATPVVAPVATPVAKPAATPVVAPVATPVAKPAATPVVAPVATPVASPAATPVVAPVATPVASPAATPAVAPIATPVAKPAATPVVAPVATPVVKPAPVPVATPVAKPAAAPKQTSSVPSAMSFEGAGFDNDELLNTKIGNYNIIWKLGEDEWGSVYVANQTTMARPVAMKVLSEEIQRNDPEAKKRFLAIAQAKAAVKHPAIISVYEAGDANGRSYYTYEYVDGSHLAEMKEKGETIDDKMALRIIKVVVEGLAYLNKREISYATLEARRIYVGKNKEPHLSNPAVIQGEGKGDIHRDIATLSRSITGLLTNGIASDSGLQTLLTRMAMGEAGGFSSWEVLLQAIAALEPKVIPADAVKLTAQEQVAIRAVEKTKHQQQRSLVFIGVGVFVLLCGVAVFLYWMLLGTNERSLGQMVHVPAGEFIYQDGKKASTGEFWIDKYEVTIGQYAKFLDALQSGSPTAYDSPDQPASKTDNHIPDNNQQSWNTWYGRARRGLPARNIPIDLNCPIFNVDYWDAYAYAKWAGKRLPTEEEWEKAARGTDGRLYPWGNKFDPKKANLGEDLIDMPNPKSKGDVDGYFYWNPVDAVKGDCSPYGAIGMLGNVAEWTGSWDEKKLHPVIRGGSFHKKQATLTFRTGSGEAKPVNPNTCLEYLGFRCASDTPPKK